MKYYCVKQHDANNMTTIFIAHRLSTIKNCDKIYVMDKGKIIEQCNHRELIELGGKYAGIVNSHWKQILIR